MREARSALCLLLTVLVMAACDDGESPAADAGEPAPDAAGCVAEPAELCDGVDNDCDGAIDEGFADLGAACMAGDGACTAAGVLVCAEDGASTTCDAVPGEGSAEVCDGIDNDCDGVVDDDIADGDPCETGQPGQCAAGVSRCVDGQTQCAPATAAVDETCDGLDNDCDGAIDEGDGDAPLTEACYGGPEGTEGIGACAAGTQVCVDGALGPCRGQLTPIDEACDAVDSDCDGAVDEDFALGDPCVVGVGACEVGGALVCDPASGGTTCDATPGEAGDETCNGIDDDCDGALDEVAGAGEPCSVGTGACAAEGEAVCGDGALVCSAIEGDPIAELCNGRDDDCDGEIDDAEGVGEPCAVGEGACRVEGLGVCDLGAEAVVCDARAGQPAPVEYCGDGIDDDCDGQTDEAACSTPCAVDADCGGATCVEGLCGEPEICDDGQDNDNDGAVDCVDPDCAEFADCGPCGNRLLDADEACDDGNRAGGDGCDGECRVEEGFICALPGYAACADGQPAEAVRPTEPVAIDPVGGNGGSAYDDPCPAGQVIVGFDYHIGNEWVFGNGEIHLQRVRAQCAEVALVDGALVLTPAGPTPDRGGVPDSQVPAGYTDEQRCPPGQVVRGFSLYGGGEYPEGMTIACGSIAYDDGVVVGDAVDLPPVGPADVVVGSSACPAGTVATDHLGRSGHVLDQVGLRCAPLTALCGIPSRCEVDAACRYPFDGPELDAVFATAGDQPWFVDGGAATSGDIGDTQRSELSMAVSTPAGGSVTFMRRVSSEPCCDALEFSVDGAGLGDWRGNLGWEEVAFELAPGDHLLRWVFFKDISLDGGEDRAQVDDIAIQGAVGLCAAP